MTRTCSVTGCARPHRRNDLCDMHDQRMKRTGTTASPVRSLADRFWEKVDKNGPTMRPELGPCWIWTAATKDGGYGVMHPTGRRSGPTVKAHRVSLELAGVDIDGLVVRHRCDNPPCVNPDHLTTGTQIENVGDAVARGRVARGAGKSKRLTEDDVRAIRRRAALGELHRDLAAEFGTARSNITRIVNRNGWTHVD